MADARQIRTKQAVYEALDGLLSEKPYGDLNVKELAARAGIGRQTFYRHFNSIDAVLHKRLESNLADQMSFAIKHAQEHSSEEWRLQITQVAFEKVSAQPNLARIMLSGEAGPDVLRLFREQIAKFWDLAQPKNLASSPPPELRPFIASFNAGAISAMLLHWIEAGCSPDAKSMSELYHSLSVCKSYEPQ